jgi:soluble lytic murein transglycosylase-like protein
MRSLWNKRINLFTLVIITKSVMLLIILSFIMGLNGWKQNFLVATTNNQSRDNAKIHLAKAVPSKNPFIELEMTSNQKNAENRYQRLIIDAAYRYKVEPAIIKAIIMAESGFNPKAVSKVGARGLMQLMPRTAKSLGVEDSLKPAHNIDAGVRYFKYLLDQFDGEMKLALAAYNAGSYNVRKYGGVPPFKETKFYIYKVLKYYEAYRTI